MASLDDTIISRQNLMLLDNVTNYKKPALDYFHHKFDSDKLEIPMTWTLLLKMRKHKLLRLPSCASEDDADYNTYLMRLHHCLWRRWSIEHYKLDKLKVDPLSINWNKETDITVLYGPDLTGACDSQLEDEKDKASTKSSMMKKHDPVVLEDEEVLAREESRSYTYSSSVDSNVSSIFDDNTCTKTHSNSSNKSLKFKDTVLRRDIDRNGCCHESNIVINDAAKIPPHLHRRKRGHHHHHHHHHHHLHHSSDSEDDVSSDDFIGYSLPILNDEKELEKNICSLKDNNYIPCN